MSDSPPDPPEPPLVLTGESTPSPPTARAGYQQRYAHYAALYQVAERTIKHWVGVGRAAQPEPDLPPLDEPATMKAWYARNKKNRVPDHLIQLAAEAARAAACGNITKAADAPPAPAPDPAAGPALTLSALPPGKPPGSAEPPPATAARGYMATLERLRTAEAAAGERYTSLILIEGRDAEAAEAERRWQKLRNDLRAYEKDAQEVMASQGKLWSADEVVAVLHDLHTVLLQSIESLYDRIETELDTLPRADRKRLYRDEVRRLRAGLVANKFTAPPAPAAPDRLAA